MYGVESAAWSTNWIWGLPLIVLNVVIHVVSLGLVSERVGRGLGGTMKRWHFMPTFAAVMSVIVLFATILHAVEAAIWAIVYRLLGALPDSKSAMLYSLGAITTYGHANLFLEDHWKMMGALEALNGMLLFGLTTAFLFAMIEKLWLLGRLERPPKS